MTLTSPRILVTGSRWWVNYNKILEALLKHGPGLVVHGACYPKPIRGVRPRRSADWLAHLVVEELGWDEEPHPANWSLGRGAGHMRNQHMVDLGADICLAFPLDDSRGTWDCVRRARAAGIPVEIIPWRQQPAGV
jgi:hypothetical protein